MAKKGNMGIEGNPSSLGRPSVKKGSLTKGGGHCIRRGWSQGSYVCIRGIPWVPRVGTACKLC